ncbi:helix-turn-helix domain-containing protein [Sporosarcina aquimarina]|uniref:helix-turn-helix domain-containing protein n=1 Tax=Sporosarcina aquimarina TaxID=114975 RepID=UPI001C8E8772|nr:helix-turn-helix transcriptional regulator [Sporosarcina aquimarina]MBY0224107.1 helix-turn-helix transcriptional regulator [Sporosarcina aquimarina]
MKPKLIGLCRHFSGYSQNELAERLGQSQYAVSKYESGLLKPSPDTVRKMKEIFAENGIGIEEIDFLNNVINKKV